MAIKEITAWLENPENNCSGGSNLVIPIVTKTKTATTSVLNMLEKNNNAVKVRIINDNNILRIRQLMK